VLSGKATLLALLVFIRLASWEIDNTPRVVEDGEQTEIIKLRKRIEDLEKRREKSD